MSWTFKSRVDRIPRNRIKPKPAPSPPPNQPAKPSIAPSVSDQFIERLINAIHRRPETRPLVLEILDELDASPDGLT